MVRKIDDTGTVDMRSALGSGRPRTARVADKIESTKLMIWFWAKILR